MVNIEIRIRDFGEEFHGDKGFGYIIKYSINHNLSIAYKNRARLLNGQYLLEEVDFLRDKSHSFEQINIVKSSKKANDNLYQMGIQAARRTLEVLTPKFENDTSIFREKIKKNQQRKTK